MPLKVTQNAWVKVPPKRQTRARNDPVESREALCAPLRYFSCTPMGSKDRIRMLTRPVSGMSGMVDVNRAPSPVAFNEGAGLMFSNGSRGGSGGGSGPLRRSRRLDRIVSEPAREPSLYDEEIEEEIVEVIEEASTVADDTGSSRRNHRAHGHGHGHGHEHRQRHESRAEPSEAGRYYDDYNDRDDVIPSPRHPIEEQQRSTRSASPPPPSTIAIHKLRHRDPLSSSASTTAHPHQTRSQYRTVSTPITSTTPRPTQRASMFSSRPAPAAPHLNGYRFESAIFQPKPSSNHYRDVHQGRRSGGGSSQGGGRWASATSALSFD